MILPGLTPMNSSIFTCWCPLGYWRLWCEGEYPAILESQHCRIVDPILLLKREEGEDLEWNQAGHAGLQLTLTVLVQHDEQALVECRPTSAPHAQARVGTLSLIAPETTLRWLDPLRPLPHLWLTLLDATGATPPPGYRQGSRVQWQERLRPVTQAVLQFIQTQELDLLLSLEQGEAVSEDQIGVVFSRIVRFLGLDACATLALLAHLEAHNLLVSQVEGCGSHGSGRDVPSGLSYLSLPFYEAITPELHTHHTALEHDRAGQLKRQRGIRALQQALQSDTQCCH